MASVVLLSGVVPGIAAPASAEPVGPPAPGQYGPPTWFPLHHDANGGEIKVGCTYRSYGTQGGYECSGHHSYWALDLLASTGTNIYASGAGFARNVTGQMNYSGYGNVVVVDHGNNVKSLYAHMSTVLVSASGAWVDQDSVIGRVGQTGDATTPHLHFEITSSGKFSSGSRDPGPLEACHGTVLETYPQAWGLSTWQGIPWGAHSAFGDGTGCSSAADSAAPAEIEPPATKAATVIVADMPTFHPLGFFGLRGTEVVYSARVASAKDGTAVVGAKVVISGSANLSCTGVTAASGIAVCRMTYGLFHAPPENSGFKVVFPGDASHLPSGGFGSIP